MNKLMIGLLAAGTLGLAGAAPLRADPGDQELENMRQRTERNAGGVFQGGDLRPRYSQFPNADLPPGVVRGQDGVPRRAVPGPQVQPRGFDYGGGGGGQRGYGGPRGGYGGGYGGGGYGGGGYGRGGFGGGYDGGYRGGYRGGYYDRGPRGYGYGGPAFVPVPVPVPSYGYRRVARFGNTCETSRGDCYVRPAPVGAGCRCAIPGFGVKRGNITD